MGYNEVWKHGLMSEIDWQKIANFTYKVPLIPSRNNGNFRCQFASNPVQVELHKAPGRKIEGFSFDNIENAEPTQQNECVNKGVGCDLKPRMIQNHCQYELMDLESETDEDDEVIQLAVNAWLADQGRFEGKAVVRNAKIFCRIGNCQKNSPFLVVEESRFDGFKRHVRNCHKLNVATEEAEASTAVKRMKKR